MATQLNRRATAMLTLWCWTDVDQISDDIARFATRMVTMRIDIARSAIRLGSDAVVRCNGWLRAKIFWVDPQVTSLYLLKISLVPAMSAASSILTNLTLLVGTAVEPAGFPESSATLTCPADQLGNAIIDNTPQLQAFVREQIYELTHTHGCDRRRTAQGLRLIWLSVLSGARENSFCRDITLR